MISPSEVRAMRVRSRELDRFLSAIESRIVEIIERHKEPGETWGDGESLFLWALESPGCEAIRDEIVDAIYDDVVDVLDWSGMRNEVADV